MDKHNFKTAAPSDNRTDQERFLDTLRHAFTVRKEDVDEAIERERQERERQKDAKPATK